MTIEESIVFYTFTILSEGQGFVFQPGLLYFCNVFIIICWLFVVDCRVLMLILNFVCQWYIDVCCRWLSSDCRLLGVAIVLLLLFPGCRLSGVGC